MTLRIPGGAALALTASLALGACGGDGGSGEAAERSAAQRTRDAELRFARCMRENGVDVPDPTVGEGGMTIVKPSTRAAREVGSSRFRKAEEACRKHLKDIQPPKLSEAQQREFREAALKHARCMRAHGVDFPDPQFGEGGGAQVRIGPGGVDPNDADFRRADKACRGELKAPAGGGVEVAP